jgi:CBS domain-containing protein
VPACGSDVGATHAAFAAARDAARRGRFYGSGWFHNALAGLEENAGGARSLIVQGDWRLTDAAGFALHRANNPGDWHLDSPAFVAGGPLPAGPGVDTCAALAIPAAELLAAPDGARFVTMTVTIYRLGAALLRTEGVLAGSSVGTLMAATLRYCREQTEPKRVVTLICDTGAKYLSKMFSDWWMVDNGFLERKTYGDLRDLIARRHLDHEDYVLSPDMPVQQAIKRMRMYGVSQLAVLDASDRVVGILDESDVLLALLKGGDGTKRPVSDFMTSRLETLPPSASVNDLLPIFRADRVAIVADDDKFHGIITRIDLINFLRKKML